MSTIMRADPVAERTALGGLERWLDDPAVSEVLVNNGGDVWVERAGALIRVGTMSCTAIDAAIERILASVGRRVDRTTPMVDARLADGSRVCAVIPPIAIDGPCIAIRRFAVAHLPLHAFGDERVVDVLTELVVTRRNLLISGATSSGKTTLLNALAQHVPATERIITLEDTAELRLAHPHVLRLEARPASADGIGEVDLTMLLRTALRLRPDRLVVGEVRGAEAALLLQALNTGHGGSMATVHANHAGDALDRLATLVLQDTTGWPLLAIERRVAASIDAVVHLERNSTGGRRAVEIGAVRVGDGGGFVLDDMIGRT